MNAASFSISPSSLCSTPRTFREHFGDGFGCVGIFGLVEGVGARQCAQADEQVDGNIRGPLLPVLKVTDRLLQVGQRGANVFHSRECDVQPQDRMGHPASIELAHRVITSAIDDLWQLTGDKARLLAKLLLHGLENRLDPGYVAQLRMRQYPEF
jgi:hypothetical protein